MTEKLNNMFDEQNIEDSIRTSSRSLPMTAALTTTASQMANTAINLMEANFEQYEKLLAESKQSADAMDKLIAETLVVDDTTVDFMRDATEDELNAMLKSQQSKRSRTKKKVMTMDNYRSMMMAAISEKLIRQVLGKAKSSTQGRRAAGAVEFTDDELRVLAEDQDKLRKEIRNVQSKKSIYKSRDDFDEESDRWTSLCKAEEQLKELRVDGVAKVDTTKVAIVELLDGKDLHTMKPAEAKALLKKIADLTAASAAAPSENETDEGGTTE